MRWGILSLLVGVTLSAYTFLLSTPSFAPSSLESFAPLQETVRLDIVNDVGKATLFNRNGMWTVGEEGVELGRMQLKKVHLLERVWKFTRGFELEVKPSDLSMKEPTITLAWTGTSAEPFRFEFWGKSTYLQGHYVKIAGSERWFLLSHEVFDYFNLSGSSLVEKSFTCGMEPASVKRFDIVPRGKRPIRVQRDEEKGWISEAGFPVDTDHIEQLIQQLSQTQALESFDTPHESTQLLSYSMSGEAGEGECSVSIVRALDERGEHLLREGSDSPVRFLVPSSIDLRWFSQEGLQDLFPMRGTLEGLTSIQLQTDTSTYRLHKHDGAQWMLDSQMADSSFVNGWLNKLLRLQARGYGVSMNYSAGEDLGKVTLGYESEREPLVLTARKGVLLDGDLKEALILECDRTPCPFVVETTVRKVLFPRRELFLTTEVR